MPKELFLSRYALIIKRLERGPATYEQIARYLEDESAIRDKNFNITQRTLQRDIKDIYTQLDIEIVNEKKGDRRYYIHSKPETEQHSQRILESYQMINAIHASQDFTEMVFLETRKPKGLEHFYGLLYAIKNKRIVHFRHYKYWDETITDRTTHALALKEAQGRWYLLAVDTKDNCLKTFGLDRMTDIDISKTKYREKYDYDFKAIFSKAFGIISDEEGKAQTVRLQFNYEQGQYVKTYPLHASQIIIEEDKNAVIIELFLYLTYDFTKALLSFGQELEVLSPTKLRRQIVKELRDAMKRYA